MLLIVKISKPIEISVGICIYALHASFTSSGIAYSVLVAWQLFIATSLVVALHCSAPSCVRLPESPSFSRRYLAWPCRPRCARPSCPQRVFEEVGRAVVCLYLSLSPPLPPSRPSPLFTLLSNQVLCSYRVAEHRCCIGQSFSDSPTGPRARTSSLRSPCLFLCGAMNASAAT